MPFHATYFFLIISTLWIVSGSSLGNSANRLELKDDTLNIEVYYESLCPDCQNFITRQLKPTWKKLGKYFEPRLIPFGKAESTPNESSGHPGYNFVCQHGLIECTGNLFQACAIRKLMMSFSTDLLIDVVSCINGDGIAFDSGRVNDATLRCMNEHGMAHDDIKHVNDCATSNKGQDVLNDQGVQTNSLDPKLTWVPWITFNGEWKQEWQDGAIANLEELLCTTFLQDKPECQNEV